MRICIEKLNDFTCKPQICLSKPLEIVKHLLKNKLKAARRLEMGSDTSEGEFMF